MSSTMPLKRHWTLLVKASASSTSSTCSSFLSPVQLASSRGSSFTATRNFYSSYYRGFTTTTPTTTITTSTPSSSPDNKSGIYNNNLPTHLQQQQHQQTPIYVCATRQHVGKTSVSLALMSGLIRRFGNQRVGFIKPVGQQALTIMMDEKSGSSAGSSKEIQVDKDAVLVKEHFGLHHIGYQDANPVLIHRGYTRDYIDGKINVQDQKNKILQAFTNVSQSSDVVLAEGTGHVAVGSVVDASNATVASWLGAHVVLVANGGIGCSLDDLALNYNMCQQRNVPVAGVIVNRVQDDKYEQIKYYLTKALQDKWGIPLLGCIPDRPFLGCPALADLERILEGSLVSGRDMYMRHYRVHELNLVATSLNVFLKNLRRNPSRTLYVCHASRNDILLGFLMEALQKIQQQGDAYKWEASLIVTGCEEYPICTQVLEIITSLSRAPPVLLTPLPTDQVMNAIYKYTPKLNIKDSNRVQAAVDHYEPHINFDLLLERCGYDKSKMASLSDPMRVVSS